MLVSKGYDNFVSPAVDSVTFQAATVFLNGFLAGNESYSLQQEIEAQEKLVANAEKKLASLQQDEKELQKKTEQIQANIQQQNQEIANQKSTLETLKLKTVIK